MKKEIVDIGISGMHCASCAQNLEKSLSNQNGIERASVNFGTESASVEFDDDKISIQQVVNTIKKSGFNIISQKITVGIGGMHCATCAQRVRDALLKMPGVLYVTVNSSTDNAIIGFVPQTVQIKDIKNSVNASGYKFMGVLDDDFDPQKLNRYE